MPLDMTPVKKGDVIAGHSVEFVRRLKGRERRSAFWDAGQIHKLRFRDPAGRCWVYIHVGPRIRGLVEPSVVEDYPAFLSRATPEQLERAAKL